MSRFVPGLLFGLLLALPARGSERPATGAPGPVGVDARASEPAVIQAAEIELNRAMQELVLPDQLRPYWIGLEILDGEVSTASASFGALSSDDHLPHRNLRAEVRVGSPDFDSANFGGAFGMRDGVNSRPLPTEDGLVALRREIWLAVDEAYRGATEQLTAKRAAREGSDRSFPPDLLPAPPLVTEALPTPQVSDAQMRDLVKALSAAMADLDGLETADAVARDWQGVRVLVNSEGTRASIPTGAAVVRVEATTRAADGARLRDVITWVARRGDRLPPVEEMAAASRDMAIALLDRRAASVEDDYLGPVLFSQRASVELFRQLLAPEICGTPPMEEGRDAFGGAPDQGPPVARLGRRLLPEGWTVVDDPAAALDEVGGYVYDFEGVVAKRVALVEDGVVRDLLMSRVGRKDRGASTGHGRSLGIDRREAVPGVVTVTPARGLGERKLEKKALTLARQAGLSYVLLVDRLLPPAMHEDFEIAFNGDGPLAGLTPPLEVWRIYADGRRERVRGLSFVGVDRRALRDIAAAGKEGAPVGVMDGTPDRRRFNIGLVGGLPATWTVPAVLITELELHGSGGGEARVLAPPPRD